MAKKNIKKKATRKSKTSSKHIHQWECPHENVFLLKPEVILLSILLVLVLVFSFATFDQSWIPTIIITLIFVLSFLLINLSLIAASFSVKSSLNAFLAIFAALS